MAQVGDRRLEMMEVDVPPVGEDEGLLRVEACGLCGSDVEQYEGLLQRKGLVEYPIIPGHEPVGIIEEIGAEASQTWGLQTGDRVAIAGPMNCGRCEKCLSGAHHLCRSLFSNAAMLPAYGLMPLSFKHGLWGGYSEYIHLHPRTLFCKIPQNVPSTVATVYQALAAGLRWAVAVPATAIGDSVLVLGCGQRGLAAVVALRRAGISQIIVTGLHRDEHKLAIARELGASHTILADSENVVERVLQLTHGRGVDVALDVVPVSGQPVMDAVGAVRSGGTIVLAGIKGGTTGVALDTDAIVTREITIKGVMTQPYSFYREAVEMLGEDCERLSSLHTHEYSLDRVAEAIRVLAGNESTEKAISICVLPSQRSR